MDILIVEDARDQRMVISSILKKKGHQVYLAENGQQALVKLQENSSIQLVISDWMMPEMDGLELCQEVRSTNFSRYIYFILLTGKSSDDAVIQGLDIGADDFLKKPVDFNELEARLKAGVRVIELEKRLEEKNQEINQALTTIETDLQSASDTLFNLLPEPGILHNSIFDWKFKPSKIMGGDMLGYVALDAENIAFYQIDVSGHGVPSALFSFSLHHLLSDINPHSSLLINEEQAEPFYSICHPHEVVKVLNSRFQTTADSTMYFTMIYGVLHSPSGQVRIVHAGHPSAFHISYSGEVKSITGNGAPVGMVPDFPYQSHTLQLEQGDALFCFTDGVTETINTANEMYGELRLKQLLAHYPDYPNHILMKKIMRNVIHWQGSELFDDDVSYMIMSWDAEGKQGDNNESRLS